MNHFGDKSFKIYSFSATFAIVLSAPLLKCLILASYTPSRNFTIIHVVYNESKIISLATTPLNNSLRHLFFTSENRVLILPFEKFLKN